MSGCLVCDEQVTTPLTSIQTLLILVWYDDGRFVPGTLLPVSAHEIPKELLIRSISRSRLMSCLYRAVAGVSQTPIRRANKNLGDRVSADT